VSRHHVLPPIIHTPEPPKAKETRRRRRTGGVQDSSAAEETDEAHEGLPAAPVRAAPPHRQSTPAEGAEQRVPSTTGKLSNDTLKTMLELQEESQPAPGASTIIKDA
jgi:hypothetical protein